MNKIMIGSGIISIGGHKILKGNFIIVLSKCIHRNENYFPELNEFKPDKDSSLKIVSIDIHMPLYRSQQAGCIGQNSP